VYRKFAQLSTILSYQTAIKKRNKRKENYSRKTSKSKNFGMDHKLYHNIDNIYDFFNVRNKLFFLAVNSQTKFHSNEKNGLYIGNVFGVEFTLGKYDCEGGINAWK
jgi:hypothetical protein